MPVHLGQIIESVAKQKGFSNIKLGELLNKHDKTVADIWTREFVSFDYLVIFSRILNTDFLKYYYLEEPFKSFREEEEAKTKDIIQRQEETIKHINEKLALAKEVISAKTVIIEDQKKRIEVLESRNTKEAYPILNDEEVKYNVEKKAGAKPNDDK
jgi:hypothetical protein